MKKRILTAVFAVLLAVLALLLLAFGLYVGETDDSPGAGGLGMILCAALLWAAWKVFSGSRKK